MTLTQDIVQQIVIVCQVIGVAAIPIAFFSWAFSGGLFVAPLDKMGPQNVAYWFVSAAVLIGLGSGLIGSGSCLIATLQLNELVCSVGVRRTVSSTPDSLRAQSLLGNGLIFVCFSLTLFIAILDILSRAEGRYGRLARQILQHRMFKESKDDS